MKIAIIGYSGAGKSTLASLLSKHYGIPKLHMDRLQFLPGWQSRPQDDVATDLKSFLDSHDSRVIDGNYSFAHYERRMAEADQIIFLNFNRIQSLWRASKRYHQFKSKSRESMAPGCPEKLDWDFVKWILWDGRQKRARDRYKHLQATYPEKLIRLKNQGQINRYLQEYINADGPSQS